MINDNQDTIPNVLIVDDDSRNLLAISTVLEDLNIKIHKASSGEQALKIVTEFEMALILLDVQMPDMDGFEVAESLHKNKLTRKIPIIFVTAINKEDKYIQKGHEFGAVDYLFKPLDPIILKSKVQVFLDYYLQNKKMLALVSELSNTKKNLENSNQQLDHLAKIDIVTGLPNRRNFDIFLKTSLYEANRYDQHLAVFYMDLDNFKMVNDTYGHAKGDSLLVETAMRIKHSIRESDLLHMQKENVIVSRLGGDEFALVLRNIQQPDDAAIVAIRIIRELNKPIIIDDVTVTIGVSIGIAYYPDAGTTVESLKKSADKAMYNAKNEGKNKFKFYSSVL